MKPVKPKILSVITFFVLAFIPGCNSSSDKSISKVAIEAIEIKGIKLGMTAKDVSAVTLDSDEISIGGVKGYVMFDYDSDDKLEHMNFSFGSWGGNAVLNAVKSKYPTAIINRDTLYRIEDMNGTTLSVGGGTLTLKSKSYVEKQSKKDKEEREKRMNDI